MIKLLVSLKKYRWDKSMDTIIDIFSITLKMYHQNFNMFSSSYSLFILFIFFPSFLFLLFFAISIFFCTHYIVFISCHWIFIKVHFNLYICKLFKKEKEYLKLMEILFSTYSRKKNSNYTPTLKRSRWSQLMSGRWRVQKGHSGFLLSILVFYCRWSSLWHERRWEILRINYITLTSPPGSISHR
jgi:hypothetical protein